MFLEISNVSKDFDSKIVLKNINLTLEKGKVLCIVGASGCGKTTLLNILGGFLKGRGSIFLDNENITDLDAEQREIATVFQSYGLFPHKTVIENVLYGLKFKKDVRENKLYLAEEMLEKVGLLKLKDKNINELSGGEKQRVALARSLVLKPKLLLLDEPFSNLDVILKNKLREQLRDLQKEINTTMILVTHDKEDVFYLANRVAVMSSGVIVQQGSVEEVYDKPANDEVATFFGYQNNCNNKKIRPENLKLVENNEGEGVIIDRKFLGALMEYKVKINNKILVVSNLSSEKRFSVGDKVAVEEKGIGDIQCL